MIYSTDKGTETKSANRPCECYDTGCEHAQTEIVCKARATMTLFRIDQQDETGSDVCDTCADDALQSGLFTC